MVLYIVGPYRPYTDDEGVTHEIPANLETARSVGEECIEAGHQVVIPHNNTHQLHDDSWDLEQAMAQDLPILERCDALLVLPDWTYSEGSQVEIEHAEKLDIPIYYYEETGVPDLHITEERCPTQARAFIQQVMRMYRVHLDKNADYSPANILGTGEIGVVTRMWDKMARLMELTGFKLDVQSPAEYTEKREAKNEALTDSYDDLAVYSVIAKLLSQGKWGH